MVELPVVLVNNNPPHSGVGRYAYSLYRYSRKLGYKIAMISLESYLFDKNYNVARKIHLGGLVLYMNYLRISNIVFNSGKIYHITNNGYLTKLIPKIKQASNAKVVVTVFDTIPFYRRELGDILLAIRAFSNIRYADFIIIDSKFTEMSLPSYLSHIPRKVIPLGVDHDLFKPRDKAWARQELGLPSTTPILLNVGTEEPRKNIPTLLRAFREVVKKMPKAKLIRVGPMERPTARLIKRLGLSDNVLYTRVDDRKFALLYNAADVYVHTAYLEGFGLPVLEAMASGTPVVAGKAASVPEIAGDAAILTDPFDVEGIAGEVLRVLTNRGLREELSQRGYQRSLRFSWEKTALETIEVYSRLVEHGH
ncbi:glycosyl transferase, group 1 [Pyrobaculum islandicum DSM 4184]|uniref:Glycosyl transferase, group 1 n=1 Tax=Pyrobaculum islandicum (strain DSM 4184 / JCM 9189 / GEO3) TaxID=384616 RepID=A1RUM0_PYRIL|nr:glycosyltransferase family 1 protein [Pyrobaculum islandicum]ABL88652.1 glycosyl transferase, group 1 [Pyrobaculum islandicum DSM 4184]